MGVWVVVGVGGLLTLHSVSLIVHFKGTFRPKQAACHSLVRVCDMLGTSADQFAETQSINRFKTTVNHQDARQVVTACFKLEHKTEPSDHKWSIRESEFTCCESDQQMIGQRDVTSGCVSPKVEFISSSSQQLAMFFFSWGWDPPAVRTAATKMEYFQLNCIWRRVFTAPPDVIWVQPRALCLTSPFCFSLRTTLSASSVSGMFFIKSTKKTPVILLCLFYSLSDSELNPTPVLLDNYILWNNNIHK